MQKYFLAFFKACHTTKANEVQVVLNPNDFNMDKDIWNDKKISSFVFTEKNKTIQTRNDMEGE